jgi:sulfonate transport system substrate-binding protein
LSTPHTSTATRHKATPLHRLGLLASGLAIASMTAVGCGSSSKSASKAASTASSSGGSSSSVATAPATVDLSGVSLKVGVFPAVGWDVELKAAGLSDTPYKVTYVTEDSGSLQLQSIASGTIDVGSASAIPPIFASQTTNNGNFKVVAATESNTLNQVTLVPKGSAITTVADLKGKKVGYVPNTTAEYFLLKQLQAAGLTFNDITPVQLSTSTGLSALLGGSIAAFADYGTTVIAAQAQGARVLADGGPILAAQTGGLVGTVVAATPDLSDPAKSAAIADYTARINGAYHWAHENPDQWAKIESSATNQPEAVALQQFQQGENQKPLTIGAIDQTSIAAEQAIADALLSAGVIKTPVTASSFWTNQLGSLLTADLAKYSS